MSSVAWASASKSRARVWSVAVSCGPAIPGVRLKSRIGSELVPFRGTASPAGVTRLRVRPKRGAGIASDLGDERAAQGATEARTNDRAADPLDRGGPVGNVVRLPAPGRAPQPPRDLPGTGDDRLAPASRMARARTAQVPGITTVIARTPLHSPGHARPSALTTSPTPVDGSTVHPFQARRPRPSPHARPPP